jgi:hypothetical protein
MSMSDSEQRTDYEAPTLAIIGTLQDLTAQKSGSEADGIKGLVGENISFPSGFRP